MDPDFSDSQDDRTQSVIKPGVEIGHYRVESYLGQGGMGQVYLARELRLDKKVAIKFLSSALNQDESFRTRFISEAKALALVNHPNVVQVFELSEYESQPFYSMEYVDGSSLPEYLKQNDPGTIELLDIAVQVTEGLTEVHEAGIIHRDIKPSNILLDKKGRAKLSDFGLAISPGAQRVTKSRAIVGTFSFMSPEQLEGKPLDHRSDIFSLGVTLYEMFSGRHPFAKESDVATMNAIANSVVDPISKVFKNTPLGLQLILDKALKKNPDDRYQNADELADDLKTLQSEMRTSTGSVTSHFINAFATRANRYKTTVVAVTFILLAAISWIIYKISSDKETELSSPVQKRLTYFNNAYWGAVSPNGHYFAYSLFDEFKGASVWVRDIDAEDPIEVFTADSVYDINWSPDSRELLFAGIKDSLSGIFLVPALGGQFRLYPHHLTELPSVTWSPDGNRFAINAATDSPRNIFIYEKKSGSSSTIQLGEDFELARSINWSPTGNKFLITSLSPNALWTMSLDGASVTLLQDETTFSPTWNNSGDAIYFLKVENDNQFLKKLKIDVKTGAPIGEPQILFTGIGSSLAAELSITSDGTKLVCTKEHRWNDLLMVSLDKANNPNIQPLKLSELATQHSWPVFSPDQKSIAYQAILSNGEAHLFVVSTDCRNRKRLTFDNFINFSPAWSPDGNRLAYGIALSRGDNYKVAIMNLDGGTPKVFENTLVSENLPKIIWWPGRKIIYQKRGNHNLGIIDPNTGTESLLFKNETDALISSPEYSSDGSRIVALYDPTPQLPPENQADSSGYWLFSVENNVEPVYLGKYDGNPIGWSSDDNWIYTLSGRSVCRINSINGTLDTVATLNMEYLWKRASITPDGNKLACLNWVFITDVWMIENFDPEI